jgi:ribosomal protein uL24
VSKNALSLIHRKISALSQELRQKYNAPSLSIQKEDEVQVDKDTTKVGKVVQVYRKKYIICMGQVQWEKAKVQLCIVSIPPCKVAIAKVKLDKDPGTKIQISPSGTGNGQI